MHNRRCHTARAPWKCCRSEPKKCSIRRHTISSNNCHFAMTLIHRKAAKMLTDIVVVIVAKFSAHFRHFRFTCVRTLANGRSNVTSVRVRLRRAAIWRFIISVTRNRRSPSMLDTLNLPTHHRVSWTAIIRAQVHRCNNWSKKRRSRQKKSGKHSSQSKMHPRLPNSSPSPKRMRCAEVSRTNVRFVIAFCHVEVLCANIIARTPENDHFDVVYAAEHSPPKAISRRISASTNWSLS